ncbi:hypothetical protein DTB58_14685 [Streptomyces griseus]|uniref:hypothetical protein n=1 Tax=Streptomyces griseus TaxID=1911 RepID=UPI001C5986BF|nr:hypothetical protein [Streptomyces griseus]MBW3705326.1 hypothetical protein [Streptomyces griseus]
MAEKTNAQLTEEVAELRTNLGKKADLSAISGLVTPKDIKATALVTDKEVLATQAWVKEETKSSIWTAVKQPEVVGFVTALAIAKLEITPFINIDPAMEAWLKKRNLERNRFGLIWKVKASELERRLRVVESAEARLVRMEKGLGTLQKLAYEAQTKLAGTNGRITREISASNRRIGVLETTVRRLDSRSTAVPQQARGAANPGPSVGGTASQLAQLEARVNRLTAALS